MSIQEGSSRGFYERLEALRGVAALWVAIGHSTIWLSFGPERALWSKAVWDIQGGQATLARALIALSNGAAAVNIFFVLSGFVLAKSLAGIPLRPITYVSYTVKRLFRIAPALWFSLVVVLSYLWLVFPGYTENLIGSIWYNWMYAQPASLSAVLNNAAFISASLNPNAWTLQVEMLASLALPFAVWALGVNGVVRSITVLATFIIAAFLTRNIFGGVIHFFYMFVLGAIVAKHANENYITRIVKTELAVVVSFLLMLGAGIAFPLDHAFFTDIIVVIGAVGVVWAISAQSEAKVLRLLDGRFVRFLGKISYSFYLLHFIALYATSTYFLKYLPLGVLLGYPLLVVLAAAVLSIAISLPFALFSFHYIEKPFTLLGRRLAALKTGTS